MEFFIILFYHIGGELHGGETYLLNNPRIFLFFIISFVNSDTLLLKQPSYERTKTARQII